MGFFKLYLETHDFNIFFLIMRLLPNISTKILFLLSIFTLYSCSKDNNEPDLLEITVSTSDFSITMDENPANGQVIGTVQGSTNQGSLSFSIIEQSPESAFSIDATSGELKVAEASLFNFEVNPILTGMVKVANGTLFEIARISITLNDLEEDRRFEGDVFLATQHEVNDFGDAGYTHITGKLVIGSSVYDDIVDLSPLLNLQKIDNVLEIANCSRLTTIEGMRNLSHIGGLVIFQNWLLEKITSFQNLFVLNGIFYIGDNLILNDISGFSQLSEIRGHFYFSDSKLSNLDALENLTYIENDFSLSYHPELTNINALSGLNIHGDKIGFYNNYSLINLDAFSNITTTISKLDIWGNLSLENINGLHNLEFTNMISIERNESLKNVDGLSKTQNVNFIRIEENNSLSNLNGLNNLRTVGDLGLYIEQNQKLTNLEGLNGIVQIGGNLSIHKNGLLRDFCALQSFLINGNPGSYNISANFYNPTIQDIRNGNCSI